MKEPAEAARLSQQLVNDNQETKQLAKTICSHFASKSPSYISMTKLSALPAINERFQANKITSEDIITVIHYAKIATTRINKVSKSR